MDENKTSIFNSSTQMILMLFGITLSFWIWYIIILNSTSKEFVSNMFQLFSTSVVAVMSYYFWQKWMFKEWPTNKETIKEIITNNNETAKSSASVVWVDIQPTNDEYSNSSIWSIMR